MPTLIRFLVLVLVLAGLGYGAMVALTLFVTPREHEVTVRIPARELLKAPERTPAARREINTNRAPATVPADQPAATEPVPAQTVAPSEVPAPEDGEVKTLSPGVE